MGNALTARKMKKVRKTTGNRINNLTRHLSLVKKLVKPFIKSSYAD